MDISEWVKAARKHKGLTQPEFAKAMQRSKANVSHWELGKHEPSLSQLKQMSQITGYSLMPLLADVIESVAPARLFRDLDQVESAVLTRIRAVFTESELPALLQSLDAYAALHPVGSNPVPTGLRFEFHRIPATQEVPAAVPGEDKTWVVNQIKHKPKPPSRRAKL